MKKINFLSFLWLIGFNLTNITILGFGAIAEASVKIGLVLDKGGRDDKSFNASAYEGTERARKELGIEFKYVEATDGNAIENLHRSFARKKMDLIIGIGFAQLEAIKKVASQFPDQKFAIVDGEISAPNVKSLLFEEHEGSYLVGAIAALKSNSSKFGFIGGMEIPLIKRFFMGYEAGIKKIKPNAQVLQQYIGVSGEAWNNPPKAKELALAQYGQGVDVIFVAAGASGSGVFDATEEVSKKSPKFSIGVDSNQNWIKPGLILTSMLKRVDIGVYETIKEVKEGNFKAGVVRYGLSSKAVDYALDKHNESLLTPEIRTRVEELKKQIVDGKIQVPDFYLISTKKK